MFPLKWLNYLLIRENFLGIHRSYCRQKKIKKYFIKFQIFVQTMFYTLFVIHESYLVLGRDYDQMKLIFVSFVVLMYINSESSILTGICYSRAFESYKRSIIRVFGCFKDDKKMTNSLNKIFYCGIACILFSAVRSMEALIAFSSSDSLISLIPVLVSQAIIRFTGVFQHFMLFFVIIIVVNLTKCLSLLVSSVQERVARRDIVSDENCDITREQIQEWVELYRDLVNCCEKVTLCFGRQYFYSLIMSMSQYTLVAYQIFYYTYVLKVRSTSGDVRIAITLLSYFTVLIMPLVAGQMMKNQGAKFHRVLVRLYCTVITDSSEAEAKLIKDFLRLLKNNPLEIKLTTKISAGLYVLPVVLTLAVNYLIVLLQFNHVI